MPISLAGMEGGTGHAIEGLVAEQAVCRLSFKISEYDPFFSFQLCRKNSSLRIGFGRSMPLDEGAQRSDEGILVC